jgi:hypothetical protein
MAAVHQKFVRRLAERKTVFLHHEVDHTAPGVAPEAVPDVLDRVHGQARRAVLVERTPGHVLTASLFGFDSVPGQHVKNTDVSFQLVYVCSRLHGWTSVFLNLVKKENAISNCQLF